MWQTKCVISDVKKSSYKHAKSFTNLLSNILFKLLLHHASSYPSIININLTCIAKMFAFIYSDLDIEWPIA